MTVADYVKHEGLNCDRREQIIIGAIAAEIAGYIRSPKVYVSQGTIKVRDWPVEILRDAVLTVARWKNKVAAKKVVVVRRKTPYITENGGD